MKKTVLLNGIERPVFSAEEASRAGYTPFTYAYDPENELWMMQNVSRDMDRAGFAICCVTVTDKREHGTVWLEVWRRAYRDRLKSDV